MYLDICREEMNETVLKIEHAVHSISPNTKLSLMTSQPEEHATEGRNWQEIFEKLSGNQPFVARPYLPSYNEVTPKVYNNGFNRVSRITAHLLGDDSLLYPELENYMYSRYAKSNQFSRFQSESSLILHPKGSTMNLFDMMGTGVVRDYHLQDMLAESKPFLSRISNLDLRVSEQKGIHVLYGTKGSYSIRTKKGENRQELIPREDSWLDLLGAFGMSSIPAGTIHSSGAGSVVLEISATPNRFTFKLWDWERVDLDGKPRSVHLQHGEPNLDMRRNEDWVKKELVNQFVVLGEGDGCIKERTGLHEMEFIETRRHTFTKSVIHENHDSVNVLNLVEGDEVTVESLDGSFEPFVVHYAQTFIIPESIKAYKITPSGTAVGQECKTMKAYIR